MTATPRSGEYSAPVNQFHRIRDFASPDFKNVVRVSRNSCGRHRSLDLDAEPVVFSHPPAKGRYLVAQVMDMWTDNFASIGSRTTGDQPGDCLIAGPRWHGTPPAGIDATYRCDTRYAWVLVQIAAADDRDFPEEHALQDGLHITPLSAWGTDYTPPAEVPVDPAADTTATPFDQVRLMDGPAFFQHLAAALKDNPPRPADAGMLKKLRRIGLQPRKDFDAGRVDPAAGAHPRHVRPCQGEDRPGPAGRDVDELGHRAAGRRLGGARRAGGLGGDRRLSNFSSPGSRH